MTNGLAKYLPIQNDWIRCFHFASFAYSFFFFFLFFRFCHVSCNNSFRSGLNRPLFSLVMHGSDPLSIILKKKNPPPHNFIQSQREVLEEERKRKKKEGSNDVYVVNTGGGRRGSGGGVGGGCRMEYALVCAGKLPVLPRCHRCKKDLRP